jgi:hypothetical protein
MKKIFLIPVLFLFSCKSTEKLTGVKVMVCDTLVFEPMHIHEKFNGKPICYEFPLNTLEIDREVNPLK